jgi:hypothetical protein
MEGKTPFNSIEYNKCLKPNSHLIHFFKSPDSILSITF